MSEQRVPETPNEIEGLQEALDTPQEETREAIDLRTKYEALKLERDDLKQQLADEELVFNHSNEIIGKYEASVVALESQIVQCLKENAALKAQVERLSAPVTDAEVAEYGLMIQPVGEDTCGLYFGLESIGDMLASRTAPAKETE